MNITVYLGAFDGKSPELKTAVSELGSWIGNSGNTLIYGGSRSGLMGLLADSALASGGKVIGVEPQFLIDACVQHPGLSDLIVTAAEGENDLTWRRLHCISGRNRDPGRNFRGHVKGFHEAAECSLHSL